MQYVIKKEFRIDSPLWLINKSEIDFSILPKSAKKDGFQKYEIYNIGLSDLIDHMTPCQKAYCKNENLLEEMEWERESYLGILSEWKNMKMIPPLMIFSEDYLEFIPFDGYHRIAICYYNRIEQIPIIIKLEDSQRLSPRIINLLSAIQ